jgi:hypothetical protein
VNPSGDAGWDGPPLDIEIPDDARELERDILAYHREQRALRRRRRLRKIMPGQAGVMPLMASILAVCLVAGMMLSVFTITPTDGTPRTHATNSRPASAAPSTNSTVARQSASAHASAASAQGTRLPTPRVSAQAQP